MMFHYGIAVMEPDRRGAWQALWFDTPPINFEHFAQRIQLAAENARYHDIDPTTATWWAVTR